MSNGDDGPGRTLGGTVGPRIARMVADATAYTRQRMGPHQAAVAQQILRDFTNHVGDELRPVLGPIWTKIAGDANAPDYLRSLASKLAGERGQAWAWMLGTTTSLAVAPSLGLYFTNLLTPAFGAAIRETPNIPLSPSDAAQATVRGLSWGPNLWTDAGMAGVNEDRFRVLMGLSSLTLSAVDIMECLNRGLMTPDDAARAFRRSGWDPDHSDYLFKLRQHLPGIEVVAALWNRGIISDADAVRMGAHDGASPETVRQYLELGGEPPAIRDLLMAWRRGIITESDVDRAIQQGPIRFEWIPVIKALQWEPLSPTEAAVAVLQGHMSADEGARRAAESGVRPEDFQTIVDSAGLPPGVELATEALNRGLLSEEEFEAAFLESSLKNRYVPLYKALRWRVIPQETVRRLYRVGVYTRDQAAERLAWSGFGPDDREALLRAEDEETDDATRELTKTELLSLYMDRGISADTLRELLSTLGYGHGAIEWLVTLADLRKERRYVDAVLTRLRSGYVAHRLDESTVSSIMDSLRIPPDQRDETISLWDLERLAVTRGLTVAQLQSALRKGIIGPGDMVTKLIHSGYSDEDANIILGLTGGTTATQ